MHTHHHHKTHTHTQHTGRPRRQSSCPGPLAGRHGTAVAPPTRRTGSGRSTCRGPRGARTRAPPGKGGGQVRTEVMDNNRMPAEIGIALSCHHILPFSWPADCTRGIPKVSCKGNPSCWLPLTVSEVEMSSKRDLSGLPSTQVFLAVCPAGSPLGWGWPADKTEPGWTALKPKWTSRPDGATHLERGKNTKHVRPLPPTTSLLCRSGIKMQKKNRNS